MSDIPEGVITRAPESGGRLWERVRRHPLARIGPGLITGAADDDPSGIATYSQAGAQFGFNMLWTMVLAYPLMSAIQSMCALIGRTTGQGLAANIKTAFPPAVLKTVVLALLAANVLNIAADVAAMGEVAELVTHINRHLMTAVVVIVTLALQIFIPYQRYVSILKWLTLSLLAYAAVLFVVHVPWHEVAIRTVWPKLTPNAAAAAMIVGVFGTTISPYLFFWQASQEVEDMEVLGAPALVRDPDSAPRERRRIRWDTWTGMFYSNLAAYFIILATAVTLHVAGVTNVDSAAKAADALRPLAGDFAFTLFAIGILGVGLLGVPVLAGSGAYALSEAMGWRFGLGRRVRDARGFYGVIAISLLAGLAIQYSPIHPMKALFYSAVINGVVAVPLMAVVILLASNKSLMGGFTASRPIVILGWIATALMGAAALCMLVPG
jgi:Mn2+/Fe2+ NRAMP family transporter